MRALPTFTQTSTAASGGGMRRQWVLLVASLCEPEWIRADASSPNSALSVTLPLPDYRRLARHWGETLERNAAHGLSSVQISRTR